MINALVVVYNKKAENSPTCMSLLRQAGCNLKVYLWDNSDGDHNLEESCRSYGWTYLGGKGNRGLSEAYNETVSILRKNYDSNDFFCPLDDDTVLPDDYFAGAETIIGNNGMKIFVPVVCSESSILSPWRENTVKSRRFFKDEDEIMSSDLNDCLAFNSGMLIPLSVFENESLQYDERLFMDGVDISFLRNAKNAGIAMCVYPQTVRHSFSANSHYDEETSINRFKTYVDDMKVCFEAKPFTGRYLVLKRAIRLTFRYRNTVFIKIAFGNGGNR